MENLLCLILIPITQITEQIPHIRKFGVLLILSYNNIGVTRAKQITRTSKSVIDFHKRTVPCLSGEKKFVITIWGIYLEDFSFIVLKMARISDPYPK